MTANRHLSSDSHNVAARIWKHGQLPMPDWVPPHMAGGIDANGTFLMKTELGNARVHPGNVIVEYRGAVWVRSPEEADSFVETLQMGTDSFFANVGPGKARQYGSPHNAREIKGSTPSSDRQERYLPPVGSLPSIEWIHLTRLSVDGTYQRSIENAASRRLIASIAAKFDWRLCAPLVVSRRPDDTLTIIDGQHRWMAACRRQDIPQLPCCVFRYESIKEEARMFILANRARRQMNRLDDYFAALAAADEDALEIQQLVTDAGLKVARNTSFTAWQPGEVAFTSSIATSIRRVGTAITSAVLTNIAIAFRDQKLIHGGAIFGALVKIMSRPNTALDPDRLLDALQSRTIDEWGASVTGLKGGDSRADALRDAILAAYDGLKSAKN